MRPGPKNAITDVAGIEVGHHTHASGLTGTTVVLAREGAVAGVDVRGSAPGTRETDLLQPSNLVERVQAVVLSGGSAYGLEAANGTVKYLEEHGLGQPVGPNQVVPIVPAAVIFDLGRGGDFQLRPTSEFGYQAAQRASGGPVEMGNVGVGTGARAGGLKGGLGSASVVLDSGIVVGAIVAVNSLGRIHHPVTGDLYARYLELAGEFGMKRPDTVPPPPTADYSDVFAEGNELRVRNTVIGVVATNAALTKVQCQKLAQMAHDGMARAIQPAHTMFDGDVIFALSTGNSGGVGPAELSNLGALAADTFSRAIIRGVLAAKSAGGMTSYREAFPEA